MESPVTLHIVAALGLHNEIGRDNQLLWKMPDDLKRFKAYTLGKPILMGRKTFQSIGRPLPQRPNIVITRDPTFTAEGCHVVHSLEEALTQAKRLHEHAMMIGGAQLFARSLPVCAVMHLTRIEASFPEADTFFPVFDESQWLLDSQRSFPADEKNPYPCRVELYHRRTHRLTTAHSTPQR